MSTPISPFDALEHDSESGTFTQTLDHDGHAINIEFYADTSSNLEQLMPTAIEFWQNRRVWFERFREYAATELLEPLNAGLDCGDGEHTAVTSAQVRQLLPAPFSVLFLFLEDDSEIVSIEMSGGEDEEILEDFCFEVQGTLAEGITSGDVILLI